MGFGGQPRSKAEHSPAAYSFSLSPLQSRGTSPLTKLPPSWLDPEVTSFSALFLIFFLGHLLIWI